MVKDSERKKAYQPRAPHKEGCMCAVCKAKRNKGISHQIIPEVVAPPIELEIVAPPPPPPPPPPTEVRLDSLPVGTKFLLGGQECRAGEKVDGVVVCYNLFLNDTMTLGGATKVEPIK